MVWIWFIIIMGINPILFAKSYVCFVVCLITNLEDLMQYTINELALSLGIKSISER